jgi:serine/threonine-protein kinase
MYKIANEEAPDIRIVRKDVPERLASVVAMSLSKRPETRYQDGAQFAADLRTAIGDISSAAPAFSQPASPARALAQTVVLGSSPTAAKPFEATVGTRPVPPTAQPGYDATQKMETGNKDEFAKTSVISRPQATGNPPGDSKTKLEP